MTPQITLSELQRKNVWDGWLGSEIRANYFADLCHRYRRAQRVIAFVTLLVSSGAAVSFFGELSLAWLWLRPALILLTAALSLWAFVVNYNKHVTDCSDLQFRWNQLAMDYEALWGDMYSGEAPNRLTMLRQREAELSKTAGGFPNRRRLLLKWQRYTVDQHATT